MSEQAIELDFFGQKIALKTGADPEVARLAVELAKDRLTDAQRRSKGAAPHQVALVALLDLAEEYVRARNRTIEYKKQIVSHAQKISEKLASASEAP